MNPRQVTNHILMIRPARFGYNFETAQSNAFQSDIDIPKEEISQRALEEFDRFVELLRTTGLNVIVIEDSPEPVKPDAIFPNNWISFHQNGYIITYPMQAPVRRLERGEYIIEQIAESFKVQAVFPLEGYEDYEQFLEGTGSMVLDRVNKIAYACLSPRTHEVVLDKFCQLTGYEKVVFHAVDKDGQEIYHTNVMMAMGDDFVVICMETIKDPKERKAVKEAFAKTKKMMVRISMEQMMAFAGNMLQVLDNQGNRHLVMSTQAYESLYPEQIKYLEQHTRLLHSDIKTIETVGGGSVRCMMAEVFLWPKKQ